MKNQYFADKRDYFKYSILRGLLEQEISCTVCWMMTPDDSTGQGAHQGYLKSPHMWRDFDPLVFDYLEEQVDNGLPDIHAIERAGPIARCCFYWAPFPPDPAGRKVYFANCLTKAASTDLVFFDPDIGPEPNKPDPNDLDKYVRWDEIARIYRAGHSVLVFNYLRGGTDQKDRLVARRSKLLQGMLSSTDVTILRTHDLAFYFAVHERHHKAVKRATTTVLEQWGNRHLWQAM